jgi:NhaP-type Na+/H+ or K+/H+ antiporter
LESVTFYLSLVLAVGVAAQWLAWRFHLPAILVLLASGFALGLYKRPGDFESLDETLLFSVVSLSVAVILFEGGLTLRFREMADCGRALVQLVVFGALLTWGLSAYFAHAVLGVSWTMANIIGSILVVTGPTVIGPLLRHVRPMGRVAAVAKWEGIVIDPVGAVLAVLVLNAVVAEEVGTATWTTIDGLLRTVLIGTATGWLASRLLVELFKRHWVPDYLDNAITLALVFITFTLSNRLQAESGLVTVTLFGVMLGNQTTTSIRHVIEFKETLRVLLISVLFIVLSSRIRLEELQALGWQAVGFVLLLIVIIRPAAVLLSTVGAELGFQERLFLSWLAPRGIVAAAVSSVFTLEIVKLNQEGLIPEALAEEARILSPLVFLVIVATVLVYGLSARWVAGLLGVSEPQPTGVLLVGADPFTIEMALILQSLEIPVLLVDSNYRKAADARMKGLRISNQLITREHVEDHLDLRGLGHLLAMTANDQVNSLALIHLSEVFDSSEQFQLVPEPRKSTGEQNVAGHLMGRLLFDKRATWAYLTDRQAAGAFIKKTPLTEDFTWKHYQDLYGESAIPLFLYSPQTRHVIICEADNPRALEPGMVLISMIDPPRETRLESEPRNAMRSELGHES